MSTIEERVEAAVSDYRTVWPEPWPLSANLALAVEAVETLERVEDQIFEEDGFIERIVDAEDKLSRIKELISAKGDDLSCGGLWVAAQGCYAGALAERIHEVLND